jgi:hypothetical protein
MKAFNLTMLSTIVVYDWPASLKFTTVDERDNPRLVYDQPEKVPFPPFPYSSKHSHFVCHFGEIPKGVTSRVHYYSIHEGLSTSQGRGPPLLCMMASQPQIHNNG